MHAKNNSTPNLLYIDGLRASAALYVVLHHSIFQYYANKLDVDRLTLVKKLSIKAFSGGHLAVNLFIVLSGFCLMLPVIKHNLTLGGNLLFFKRRIIRILPPYYLAVLISVILIWLFIGRKTGTHWDISVPVTYKDILAHGLLIHDFFRNHTFQINHSLWSISVECRIYIFFPLLIYFWRKLGPVSTLLIATLMSYLMHLCLLYLKSFYPAINSTLAGVNPYIILFTLGMLAAHCSFYSFKIERWRNRFPSRTIFILSFILYIATSLVVDKIINKDQGRTDSFISDTPDIAFGLCCFFFLILCSKRNEHQKFYYPWIRHILSWQPLVFLGSFSYSLYLIHAPLLQLLSQFVIEPLHLSRFVSAYLLTIVSVLVVIPLSYLFFIAFEKPFMKFGKKMSVKQTELNAVLNPAP